METDSCNSIIQNITIDENFITLANSSFEIIIIHNFSEVLYANYATINKLKAKSFDDLKKRKVIEFVHPDEIEKIKVRFKKLSEGYPAEPSVSKVLDFEGNILEFELAGTPVIYNDQLCVLLTGRDVTEINQYIVELKNTKDNLKAIIETIPDIMLIIDRKFIIRDYYAKDTDYLLTKPENFLNKNIIDVLPEYLVILTKENIKKTFNGEKNVVYKYPLEMNNKTNWYEARLFKKNENEVLALIRDITKDEELLQEYFYQKNFLNLLIDLAQIFLTANTKNYSEAINISLEKIGKLINTDRIYIFEADSTLSTISNTFEWCNDNIEPAMHLNQNLDFNIFPDMKDTLLKGNFYIIDNLENLKDTNPNLYEFLKLQNIISLILIPIFIEGKFFGFVGLDFCTEGKTYNSNDIKLLIVFTELISNLFWKIFKFQALEVKNQELERIRKENLSLIENLQYEIKERVETEEELLISRLQLESTIETTHTVAVQWYDKEGKILYWNRASEMIFGYTRDECLGKTLLGLLYHDEESHTDFLNKINLIDTTNSPLGPFEAEIIDKNHQRHILLSTLFSIRSKGNDKIFVCMDVDITKMKQLEQQLKDTISEKDKFFSIIAHDLKTPFMGFLGGTKLIAEEINNLSMAELQELAFHLQKSATNLLKLLENLLEWSRIQRGMVKFNPENFDLYNLITNNINLVEARSQMKNIKIITNVKENTTIKADMNMLNAILRNLISNAIKFSNSGSTIEVNANKNHLGYIISVKDQGIGIPEELKDHIFSTTGKTSRKGTDGEDSTGLGLVLCKEYVLKHNGKIWFESKVNEGTTFYIEIPQ